MEKHCSIVYYHYLYLQFLYIQDNSYTKQRVYDNLSAGRGNDEQHGNSGYTQPPKKTALK